jgi:hypothetical protein
MGAVAIFYFFATAFAMAVACCGPDARAKLCSAYLMGSWAFSNAIFLQNTPADALELYTVPDLLAALVVYLVWLRWPSRWLTLFLAALSVQVIFQLYDRMNPPGEAGAAAAHWVNELMFDLQLLAVCSPTVVQLWRRFRPRPRQRVKASIPPPYVGWHPPDAP